jgi:hypothetical protein
MTDDAPDPDDVGDMPTSVADLLAHDTLTREWPFVRRVVARLQRTYALILRHDPAMRERIAGNLDDLADALDDTATRRRDDAPDR